MYIVFGIRSVRSSLRSNSSLTRILFEVEDERERDPYFSVVTGTHYGTKTLPDQQPTNPCAGVMTRRGRYLQDVFKYGL